MSQQNVPSFPTTATPTDDYLIRISGLMASEQVQAQELAEAIGVSKSVMSRILNGQRKLSAAELRVIADRLNTTASALLGQQTRSTRSLAVAARLGAADRGVGGAGVPTMDVLLSRARGLLELRALLSQLVDAPARPSGVAVAVPGASHFTNMAELLAARAREALAIGDEPIRNLVGLIESRFGVDVSVEPLPGDVHGLFVTDPDALPTSTSARGTGAISTPGEVVGERVAVMLVNSSDTYGRQRFTLAHELAHLLFGDAELYVAEVVGGASVKEKRANSFASAFLMPAGGVRDIATGLGAKPGPDAGDDCYLWTARLVCDVAFTFGASIESAQYRAKNLDLITQAELTRLRGRSAFMVLADCGRTDERDQLDADHVNVIEPPPYLLDQALSAYVQGMVGVEPLAALWRADDAEELRRDLAVTGWDPQFA